MPLCISPDCVSPLPFGVDGDCAQDTALGGIKRLIVSKCTVSFTDGSNPITDSSSWEAFFNARSSMLMPVLASGEKPDTDKQTQRISTCGTDRVINKTHTITGFSVIVDADNRDEFASWKTLNDNLQDYLIGWIGCDGQVYCDYTEGGTSYPGFYMEGSVEHVIPENSDSVQQYMFNFTWKNRSLIPFVSVPGLEAAYQGAPIS